jgi:DNA-directed RNA polymerase specialized sigma54-like protein
MIIFKLKEKMFDLPFTEIDGYFWGSVNKTWTLLYKNINEVEIDDNSKCVEFLPGNFMFYQKPNPSDLQKPKHVGEYLILADGYEWQFKTIAEVKMRYVHDGFDETGKVRISKEADDPLFDYLLEQMENLKKDVEIDLLIDIIIRCLEQNYYITREIILALKLLDDEIIKNAIYTIYQYDKIRRVSNEFFRTGSNELQAGETDPS